MATCGSQKTIYVSYQLWCGVGVVEIKPAEYTRTYIIYKGYQCEPCKCIGVSALTARHFLHVDKQICVGFFALPLITSIFVVVIMQRTCCIILRGVWGLDIFQQTFGTTATVTHSSTYLNCPFLPSPH